MLFEASRYFISLLDEKNSMFWANLARSLEHLKLSPFVPIYSQSFKRYCVNLQNILYENPEVVFGILRASLHHVLYQRFCDRYDSLDLFVPQIRFFFQESDQFSQIKNIKASMIGKFITIKGTVVRISSVKPLISSMRFACNHCDTEQTVQFDSVDGVKSTSVKPYTYRLPSNCPLSGCRSKTFSPLRDDYETCSVDSQIVKIQEKLLSDTNEDAGRVPRTIECDVKADLVETVVPGDLVVVSGIVKHENIEESQRRKAVQTTAMHTIYLEVNNISKTLQLVENNVENSSEKSDEEDEDMASAQVFSKDSVEITARDLISIQEISQKPNLFKLLVNSLCPAIFGHEIVKAGLLLALFGGRQRYLTNQADVMSIRGDSHVLVVGDPGLGKSQMLSYVSKLAPRGVYVSSNTTTASGLTVTLTKESGTGEFALEAGALVLGDQGCCCIDEFDKMKDYEALLEAMEQQSISIAKAGIVCTLPARTCVIAAANPVGGHYNKGLTVSENLKMESALLSRFDLVFILLDRPDEEMDKFLSEHVMRLHSKNSSSKKRRHDLSLRRESFGSLESQPSEKETLPLKNRLKYDADEIFEPISSSQLRKYISYSRKSAQPRLSTSAAACLQDFYLELRTKYRSQDTAPITTRQLESMIRLSEARARAELRKTVTKQDALDVIDIMRSSLYQTAENTSGRLDFRRSQMGTGMSRSKALKWFAARMRSEAETTSKYEYSFDELLDIAQKVGLPCDNFRDFIDLANHQNYFIKLGRNRYKLCI